MHRAAVAVMILFLSALGCGGGDDPADPLHDMSGSWTFTLSPTPEELEKDPAATPSSYDDILISQNGNVISGNNAAFAFAGEYLDANTAVVRVAHNVDAGSLDHISEMSLRFADANHLVGTGVFHEGKKVSSASSGTFLVDAFRQAGDATRRALEKISPLETIMCSVAGSLAGMAIGSLTDGSYRPMASCAPKNEGSGYFIFGQTGPGSIYPVWTQTAYFPYQFSFCGSAGYSFSLSLGENLEYIDAILTTLAEQQELFLKLKFASIEEAIADVRNFYNTYGEFAISLGSNTADGSVMIFINLQNVDKNPMANVFITKLRRGLEMLGATNVQIIWGPNLGAGVILRRDGTGECSTPFLLSYLVGTRKVNYQ